jgi:hypothetical protein
MSEDKSLFYLVFATPVTEMSQPAGLPVFGIFGSSWPSSNNLQLLRQRTGVNQFAHINVYHSTRQEKNILIIYYGRTQQPFRMYLPVLWWAGASFHCVNWMVFAKHPPTFIGNCNESSAWETWELNEQACFRLLPVVWSSGLWNIQCILWSRHARPISSITVLHEYYFAIYLAGYVYIYHNTILEYL